MSLRSDLEILLKSHCADANSNTPEFILAMFLTECLAAFDKAVSGRSKWFKLIQDEKAILERRRNWTEKLLKI